MLHFDRWTGKNEKVTVSVEIDVATALLKMGKNVIVDDTNLGQSHKDMWMQVAEDCGAKFEVIDMMKDVSVEECISRDSCREKSVGAHVILNMAMQYDLLPHMKDIVVCDIDGTVADITHRLKYASGEEKDWGKFFAGINEDTERWGVYVLAHSLASMNNAQLIFVTARPEDYREETEAWLEEKDMPYDHMIMRRSGDKRPDTDVKQQIFDTYLEKYNIIKVFDDRPAVIRMWRENGLDVEDVGNGIEF